MKGYFFNRGERQNVLYIPRNLVVVEKNDSEIIVDYYPNNIKAFDLIWDNSRRMLLGDFEKCIISHLEIPENIIKQFSDYCFDNSPKSVISAHIFAISLFDDVKLNVNNFRGD
ncbi:MAG: hypothetical protein ACP5OG_05460 [Candidatus Nanoarchaeia archaeon]